MENSNPGRGLSEGSTTGFTSAKIDRKATTQCALVESCYNEEDDVAPRTGLSDKSRSPRRRLASPIRSHFASLANLSNCRSASYHQLAVSYHAHIWATNYGLGEATKRQGLRYKLLSRQTVNLVLGTFITVSGPLAKKGS